MNTSNLTKDFSDMESIYIRRLKTVSIKIKPTQRCNRASAGGHSINFTHELFGVLRPLYARLDDEQEHLILLVLNNCKDLTGFKVICSGARNSGAISVQMIFRSALLLGAESIIVSHNHPSGNVKPSTDDIETTRRIVDAGLMLNMPLIDHLVFSPEWYYSMAIEMPALFATEHCGGVA